MIYAVCAKITTGCTNQKSILLPLDFSGHLIVISVQRREKQQGEDRLLNCVQRNDLCTLIVDYQAPPLTSIVNIF